MTVLNSLERRRKAGALMAIMGWAEIQSSVDFESEWNNLVNFFIQLRHCETCELDECCCRLVLISVLH